jgi:hypothetical protein
MFSREHLNYFDTPALHCWWGDPVRWEIAVLAIAALSLFVVIRSACGRLQRFWSAIPLIMVVLPSVVGALFSLVQIHLIFDTLATAGWAGPHRPSGDDLLCAIFNPYRPLLLHRAPCDLDDALWS